MTTTQHRVLYGINQTPCLVVDGKALVLARTTFGIHDDPDDLAVELEWQDEDGCGWEAQFTERSLAEAKIRGNRIQMRDSLGVEVELTAFRFQPANV